MQFITMDFNLADRILKSPYCLSLVSWEGGRIEDIYSTFIAPDCDVEDVLAKKNHIMYDLSKAPSLPDIWPEVGKIIEGKTVFFPDGTSNVSDLIERLAVDYLVMPEISYASYFSMVARVWPELSKVMITKWPKPTANKEETRLSKTVKEYNFTEIGKYFNVEPRQYNNLDNPLNMGLVINKALDKVDTESVERLFDLCGYAGGIVTGGQKFHYRAVKEKKSGEYYRNFQTKI